MIGLPVFSPKPNDTFPAESGSSTKAERLDVRSFILGLLVACAALSAVLIVQKPLRLHQTFNISALGDTRYEPMRGENTFLGVELDRSKLAFLLETRHQPHLISSILHFIMVAPPEWPFLVVGSEEVVQQLRAKDNIRILENIGKLRIDLLDPEWPITSGETLSQATTNISFYDRYVGTAEHLFFWQSDSMLCANSQQSLNDWLGYDWVGAPWSVSWLPDHGGNGGLSMRRMSSLRKVLHDYTREPGDPAMEDEWLVEKLWGYANNTVVLAETAQRFSVEGVWAEKPMAFHVGGDGVTMYYSHIYQNQERWQQIMQWCPELKLVFPTLRGPQ